MKTNSLNNESYTEKYNDLEYLALRAEDAKRLCSQLRPLKIFKKNSRILDAGCGSGEFGAALISNFKVKVNGFDQNKQGVMNSKKKGLVVKEGDIGRKWKYSDSSFNAVLGVQILEHLVNPDHFLEESKRVLKKEGFLIITTPNLAVWFNRIIFLFGFQPFFTEVSTLDKTLGLSFTRKITPNRKPLGHLRCFTLKALKEILELHGFKIIAVKGSTVSYFPIFMRPFDKFFALFPSLSTDLVVVAKK